MRSFGGLLKFKACFFLISAGFFVFAFGTTIRQTSVPRQWTLEKWTEWRDHHIQSIFLPTIVSGNSRILSREDVILRCVDAYKEAASVIEDPAFFARNPNLKRPLGNFFAFIRNQAELARYDAKGTYTHALGYRISDLSYWQRSASVLAFPSLLKSREFLLALASPQSYKAAIDLIDKHNGTLSAFQKWQAVFFRSRFLKSADSASFGRLLVLVPNQLAPNGDLVDQWIQFSVEVPDGSPSKPTKSVSMVVVRRDSGQRGYVDAFLGDFMRERDAVTKDWTISPTVFMSKNPSKNCYDCHKSPVIPIHPKSQYGLDDKGLLSEISAGGTLSALNDRIAEYGECRISSMNMDSFGPSIGQNEASNDRILEESRDPTLSSESLARIKKAMQCASCHGKVAPINYPAAVNSNIGTAIFEQKQGLAETYVKQGWMPPGNNLTASERKALWNCLSAEYLDSADKTEPSGVLIDWLKGK